MEKVKLMCSYGGRIQPSPHRHDLQLSYVGGHTKILTVDRKIKFSDLFSKLTDLCECNLHIQVKYKLPGEDFTALISVLDDDDVDHMMFEYDRLRRVSSNPVRFRLFVFYPATVKTGTARTLNPDFLFGFDKEYSADVEAWKIPGNADVPLIPVNAGAPNLYRIPANPGGCFLTGVYGLYPETTGNRESR